MDEIRFAVNADRSIGDRLGPGARALAMGNSPPDRHRRTRNDRRSAADPRHRASVRSRAPAAASLAGSAPDMAISITTWCAGTTAVSTRWASHQTMTPGSRCAIAGSSGTHFLAQPNRARPPVGAAHRLGSASIRGPASGRWHPRDDPHLFELAQLVAQHRTGDVARETVGQELKPCEPNNTSSRTMSRLHRSPRRSTAFVNAQ